MGNCGELYCSVVAGVMVGGAIIGGRLAACEGVRYIFVGVLVELLLSAGILNLSVGALIHFPTILLL